MSSDKRKLPTRLLTREERAEKRAKITERVATESFNERHISVANQIMNAKRTSMQPDLLSWLAVLRMNRKWIEQRKKDFGHLLLFLDMGELEGITVMQ